MSRKIAQCHHEPKAVDLGRTIFGDTSFSGNGAVACTTCHKPDLHFTDGRPFASVRSRDVATPSGR